MSMNPQIFSRRICSLGTLFVCLFVLSIGDGEAQEDTKIGDSITAGIQTQEMMDAIPYGFRVSWIMWDSAFRDSDLQLGDRIIGVNGFRYDSVPRRTIFAKAIGGYAETQYWEAEGAKDGTEITLLVYRNQEIVEVRGKVLANRFYYNKDAKQTMGQGGPARLLPEKNESGKKVFDSSWAGWYEKKIKGPISWPFLLYPGWERTSFNNRKELEKHFGDKERIDYLTSKYPSKFSETMKQDWEQVRIYLEGTVVDLPEDVLAYRTRQEELRKQVQDITQSTIQAFEKELGERLISSPGISRGDLEEQKKNYVGKVVFLDGLSQRNIINDLEQTFMVAGNDRKGYYFLHGESPVMSKVFTTLFRYQSLVNPKLAERYSVYIEVLDDPRIITFKGSPVMGLLGNIVGFIAGTKEAFIDARQTEGDLTFAGEIEAQVEAPCSLKPEGTPAETMTCLVEAVKYGDRKTWESLFAEWRFVSLGPETPPIFYPDYRVRAAMYNSDWEHSRRNITKDVYDARINRVSPISVIYDKDNDDSIPKIEEVTVILDHIGLIDDEYRTFTNLNVRRVWKLQRLDNGPWKITQPQRL